jgi:inositol-phosphate phosphatase / L-galactose 1-phosphate phosphatase / histidinol-phosphatase
LPTFEALKARAGTTIYGGDCMNYGLLASGFVDIVIETGLKLHDFAALVPIVEGAGGQMTDWNGQPLHMQSDGRVLAIGDRTLAQGLLS